MRRMVREVRYAPQCFDVLEAQSRPAMQKSSTLPRSGKNVFRGQLTIGLDLGDRSSSYCVLDEAG